MVARVIDYAWGQPGVAALKAEGAVAVCRYLAYPSTATSGKLLTRAEADGLRAAGIAIVSNWEQAGSWTEFSGGAATGAAHAREAARQHLACGGPPDRPIYFSTDFNPTPAQLPAVEAYYRGVASVIGLVRTGAYGGYTTIKYLLEQDVIRWGWQTYAWSAGQWHPGTALRQVRNGVLIGGVDCDLNDAMTADFGQWGGGDVADFDQNDANFGNGERNLYSVYNIMLALEALDEGHSGGTWWNDDGPTARTNELIRTLKRIDLNAKAAASLSTTVTMTAEDRAAIVAALGSLIPSAADVAEELAKRLGNG